MGLIRKEDLHETLLNSLSNPNLLINGDPQVWQRGTTFACKPGIQYTADRWAMWTSGNPTIANKIWNLEWIGDGNDNLIQMVELSSQNMAKDMTLSFLGRAEQGVSVTYGVMQASGVQTIVEGADKNVENSFIGDGEWHKYKLNISSTVTNASIIKVYFKCGETGRGKKIDLTNIKLELGYLATPFISRPYGEELALCQRYYEHSTLVTRGLIGSELTRLSFDAKYKQTKRIVPTLKIYGLNSEEGTVAGKIGSSMNFPIHVYQNCVDGFGCIDITDNKGQSFVSGESFEMHAWISDAEIY